MAVSTSAVITANIEVTQVKPKADTVADSNLTLKSKSQPYTFAYATSDLNTAFVARYAIAGSGDEDVDLSGTLEDLFGDEAVFVTVKGVLIVNHSNSPLGGQTATDADVTVTGNFLDNNLGSSFSADLAAGGMFMFSEPGGLGVVNSSSDTITITNNDGVDTAYVDVVAIGADMSGI